MTRFTDSASMKYRRAQYHYRCLHAEYQRLAKRNLALGPHSHQVAAGKPVQIEPRIQPSSRWGLIIGDCVGNLRSALDHAVFQLVPEAVRTKYADQISFPVYETAPAYSKWKAANRDWLKAVEPKALAVIDAFQPCVPVGMNPRDHMLWKLKRLSNLDKHRSIHVALLGIDRIESPTPFVVQQLDPETGTIFLESAMTENETVHFKVGVVVAFADGEDIAHLPVFQTLRLAGQAVSTALNQLRPFM